MAEEFVAGLQTWELPTAGVDDTIRTAILANQPLTRLGEPWGRASLDAADTAARHARGFITTRKNRSTIQLRRRFLYRASTEDPTPPGLAVPTSALSTYLALLWLGSGTGKVATDPAVATDPVFAERPGDDKDSPLLHPVHGLRLCAYDPHTVSLDANRLGAVLGIGGQPANRRERVRTRLVKLEERNVIRRDRTPGPETRLQLLDDAGSGEVYSKPFETGGYLQVPVTLFTNGWAAVLSPRAFLAYLLIIYLDTQNPTNKRLGERTREAYFPVSDEIFYPGRGELAWWGLISLTAGGSRVRGDLHRVVYNHLVPKATNRRPRDVYERIIVPAGLDPAGRLAS